MRTRCEIVKNISMKMCRLSRQLDSKMSGQRMRQMLTRIRTKMEMVSSAASKVMNSAAACELTSAEVWTLAKTAIEVFGSSVSRFANKFTSYNIDSSLVIDLTTRRDDGTILGPWYGRGHREAGANATGNTKQKHLIGSAPCTSFCTLLYPCEKPTNHQLERMQHQEGQYTQA